MADQALSSLTNFVIGFLAARGLSQSEFGAFAVVFAVFLIGLGVTRAINSEPFVIRYSAVSADRWRHGATWATGTALAVGALGGVACLVAGIIAGGALGSGLVAVGVALPGLMLQDTWRFTFFAARRGRSAFTNDAAWVLALAAGVALLAVADSWSVGSLVLAWGGAGTLAGVIGILQAGVVPTPNRSLDWLRDQRDLAPRFLGEFTVTTLVSQITVFGLGILAGLADVGALRAGTLLLGPLNVLFLGVGIVAVPEGVRALVSAKEKLLRVCRRLSITLASFALAFGTAMWLLPDRIGVALIRENWHAGHSVIIPLTLVVAFSGILLGAGIGLRSLAAAKLSFRARLLVAPISLVAGLGGAVLAGAVGAAWGMAFAFVVGAIIWWRYFLKGLRAHVVGPPDERAATDVYPVIHGDA
ncbi:MAG TPA: hypothetical protein VF058_02145 [Actinomycetota bacterium]